MLKATPVGNEYGLAYGYSIKTSNRDRPNSNGARCKQTARPHFAETFVFAI